MILSLFGKEFLEIKYQFYYKIIQFHFIFVIFIIFIIYIYI